MSEADVTDGEQIPDGAIRDIYKGRTRFVKIAALPGGNEVLCAGSNLALEVFSSTTGKCLYALCRHKKKIVSVAVLGEDEVVTSCEAGVIRVWRISHQCLLQTISTDDGSSCVIASLGGGHVVIGRKNGTMYEMVWDGVLLAASGRELATTDSTEMNLICAIAVHKNRFITSSQDGTVRVWSNSSFCSLATIELLEEYGDDEYGQLSYNPASAMAMSDRWIGIWRLSHEDIHIFEAATYEPKVELQRTACHGRSKLSQYTSPPKVQQLVFTCDNEHVIEVANDGIIIYNVSNGYVVWSRLSDFWACALLSDGRLLVSQQRVMPVKTSGYYSQSEKHEENRLTVLYPVPEAATIITLPPDVFDVVPMEIEPAVPLQDALASILSARSDVQRRCHELVRSDLCSRSISEWNCAHQLLMLAVCEGSIPKSEDYQGKKQWWLYQLYLSACHFTITTREDENIIRHCLREASQHELIRTKKVVLDMLKFARPMPETPGLVRGSLTRMYNRLASQEGRVNTLKQTYAEYTRTKRVSCAAGVAFQLILHFGASLENLFAAEEVSDSAEEADSPNYSSRTPTANDAEDRPYFVHCLLLRLSSMLSDDHGSRLKIAGGEGSQKFLRACGLDVKTLRTEFVNAGADTEVERSTEMCGFPIRDGETRKELPVQTDEAVIKEGSAHSAHESTSKGNPEVQIIANVGVASGLGIQESKSRFRHPTLQTNMGNQLHNFYSSVAELLQELDDHNIARFNSLEKKMELLIQTEKNLRIIEEPTPVYKKIGPE